MHNELGQVLHQIAHDQIHRLFPFYCLFSAELFLVQQSVKALCHSEIGSKTFLRSLRCKCLCEISGTHMIPSPPSYLRMSLPFLSYLRMSSCAPCCTMLGAAVVSLRTVKCKRPAHAPNPRERKVIKAALILPMQCRHPEDMDPVAAMHLARTPEGSKRSWRCQAAPPTSRRAGSIAEALCTGVTDA